MTAAHETNEIDGPHEGPIKTPKQLILAVLFAFVVPIFGIILLVMYVTTETRPSAGSEARAPKSIAERIRPVGSVEIKDASDAASMKTGEQVFAAQCTACHATGALNAPKLGDAAAWGPRIAAGFNALLHSALAGKGQMPAQGGGDFSEFEIGRAVVYMANQGGAKFPEPAAPAAGASAPAATTAAASAAAPATTVAAAPAAPAKEAVLLPHRPRRRSPMPAPCPPSTPSPAPSATPRAWPARRRSATRRRGRRASPRASTAWWPASSRARARCRRAAARPPATAEIKTVVFLDGRSGQVAGFGTRISRPRAGFFLSGRLCVSGWRRWLGARRR
jgi:cytochrome c5